MTDYTPTLAGFQAFLQNFVGIPLTALPLNSAVTPVAFQIALDLVNSAILYSGFPLEYQLAVYNLATSNVINYAPDITNVYYPSPPADPDGTGNNLGYFSYLRWSFDINDFVGGVINSSSDNGTSESLSVPDSLANLSLADLQYLKDPYGRRYLAFAQKFGAAWGLS